MHLVRGPLFFLEFSSTKCELHKPPNYAGISNMQALSIVHPPRPTKGRYVNHAPLSNLCVFFLSCSSCLCSPVAFLPPPRCFIFRAIEAVSRNHQCKKPLQGSHFFDCWSHPLPLVSNALWPFQINRHCLYKYAHPAGEAALLQLCSLQSYSGGRVQLFFIAADWTLGLFMRNALVWTHSFPSKNSATLWPGCRVAVRDKACSNKQARKRRTAVFNFMLQI